jgi:hypothetical protein
MSTVGCGTRVLGSGAPTTTDMRRSPIWFATHLVHNCMAHPLLPLAEVLDLIHLPRVACMLYRFHDLTIPRGDVYNKQRYF